MEETYRKTHKTPPTKKQLEEWYDKFPIMLDRWMEAEKKEIKKRIANPIKKKKYQERHQVSQLRNRTIIAQMCKLGYYGVNEGSKMAKMKEGLENDEIINVLIQEISDPVGGDHDMIEIDYDKQFKQHIKEYENRYKNVYVVEDLPEKPKEEKPLTQRQINYQSHPNIQIKRMPPIYPNKNKICMVCGTMGKQLYSEPCFKKKPEIHKTIEEKPMQKPKKEVKKKEKLTSTIIVSDNPIKISPVKTLELNEPKKPRKKSMKIKKLPEISKKIPIKVQKKSRESPKKMPQQKKKPQLQKKSSLTVYYRIINGKRVRLKRRKPKSKIKK